MSQPGDDSEPDDGLEFIQPVESPEAVRARKMRNWLLGGVLAAFVVLVFVVTLVRLGGHVFK
jgi:hypothetical protein